MMQQALVLNAISKPFFCRLLHACSSIFLFVEDIWTPQSVHI